MSQVPFNHTFVNYRGVNEPEGVIEYIKKLFEKRSGERKIYTHVTQATDKGGGNLTRFYFQLPMSHHQKKTQIHVPSSIFQHN